MGKVLFMVFLGIAAWQDARSKEVDAWLYVVFGGLVWFEKLCFSWPVQMGPEILNILPGAAMLLLSRWSEGAIGEGDGWFFVIAGVALGWKKVLQYFWPVCFYAASGVQGLRCGEKCGMFPCGNEPFPSCPLLCLLFCGC